MSKFYKRIKSLPQTLIFNPHIFATQCRRPQICQTMDSVRSNSLSFKYVMFTFLIFFIFQAAASSPYPFSPLLPHLPMHRPMYSPHPSFLPFPPPSLQDFMKPSPELPLHPSPPSPRNLEKSKDEEKNKNLFQPYLDAEQKIKP